METTKEQESGLPHQILPPRLEDAGLEDCALPPDSIKEAFLKAADAVKSRAASFFTSYEDDDAKGNCVNDPWPAAKDRSDEVVGVSREPETPGPCATLKGGGAVNVCGYKVVSSGGEGKKDWLVDGGKEWRVAGKACVEGLQGLEIEEKKVKNRNGLDEEEDDDKEPVLVEAYI